MPPALPVTPCGLAGEDCDHTGSPSREAAIFPVAIGVLVCLAPNGSRYADFV
jgi:hypothetical protein